MTDLLEQLKLHNITPLGNTIQLRYYSLQECYSTIASGRFFMHALFSIT